MERPCDACSYPNDVKHQICRSCGHIIEEIQEVTLPPEAPPPARLPPPLAPPPPPHRRRADTDAEDEAPRARSRRFLRWKRREASGDDERKIGIWTIGAVLFVMLLVGMCST